MKLTHPIFLIAFIFLIITIVLIALYQDVYTTKQPINNTTSIESNNASIINVTKPEANITSNFTNNNLEENLQPVDSNYVFNNINWSRYSYIDGMGVHDNDVSGPTSVINHTHIWFTVDINVKNPDNTNDIFREMAGVVVEIRQMIGPNSTPGVYGLHNGYLRYFVTMMPYENRIYASDHYHPQAYKNEIYLIPGDDVYDFRSYALINNSLIEN